MCREVGAPELLAILMVPLTCSPSLLPHAKTNISGPPVFGSSLHQCVTQGQALAELQDQVLLPVDNGLDECAEVIADQDKRKYCREQKSNLKALMVSVCKVV